MAFDKNELEVYQILLKFPRLVFDSEIGRMFPFSWGSKKKRTMRRSSPLSCRKTPPPFPKSKIRITLKIKKTLLENNNNHHHHQYSSRCGDNNKERSCFCAVNDESSKRKKLMKQSSESSRPFRIPYLNLPPVIEEEEEHWSGICDKSKKRKSPRPVSGA